MMETKIGVINHLLSYLSKKKIKKKEKIRFCKIVISVSLNSMGFFFFQVTKSVYYVIRVRCFLPQFGQMSEYIQTIWRSPDPGN